MNKANWIRVVQTCGILCAPMIGISLLLSKLGYIQVNSRADGILSTLYIAGFLCIAILLRLYRVGGTGAFGTAISAVQITGLALAEIWALLTALGSPRSFKQVMAATDLAWPFSHLFMLVVGIAACRAKIWNGWPVYMILLSGVALPAAMAAVRVFGELGEVIAFGVMTSVPLTAIAMKNDARVSADELELKAGKE